MEITNDIKYIGVNDFDIKLFEGQYSVEKGMAYNSYIITDEKTAVMDTVSDGFGDEWLKNIKNILGAKTPDYLVIQHMEPDHSANISLFMSEYPDAVIVSSAMAFNMMKNFYKNDYAERRIVVKEGDSLSTGRHTLSFIAAPMVHWPEVMVTYDSSDKVLFSADAFGKFGTTDADEDWADEARRYYFGIVGKFGVQSQALLKKASALDIEKICPLHGPVLIENLGYYLGLYNAWTSYEPENDGVVIAYASVYGHTEKAAETLASKLREKGCPNVILADLTRCDMSEAVSNAFRYKKTVFASVTYNADVFPCMREFINNLTERNFQNRTVGFIENGSWAAVSAKKMKEMLSECKNLAFAETSVKVTSSLNSESEVQIEKLADELLK